VRIWNEYARDGGLLVVLSGPSGVGKDAVLSEFVRICPEVKRCVATTTRAKRAAEVDGVDYNFVTVEEFERRREQDGFLEWAVYCGNMYGTPREWVREQTAQGTDVILKIEVQGGCKVKRQAPDCVMIFLVPPTMEELERRLRSRLTESEDEIEGRLMRARREMEYIPDYEYVIENDSVQRAAEELKAVIRAEHCRIRK